VQYTGWIIPWRAIPKYQIVLSGVICLIAVLFSSLLPLQIRLRVLSRGEKHVASDD
jgi:hypothetical protein